MMKSQRQFSNSSFFSKFPSASTPHTRPLFLFLFSRVQTADTPFMAHVYTSHVLVSLQEKSRCISKRSGQREFVPRDALHELDYTGVGHLTCRWGTEYMLNERLGPTAIRIPLVGFRNCWISTEYLKVGSPAWIVEYRVRYNIVRYSTVQYGTE